MAFAVTALLMPPSSPPLRTCTVPGSSLVSQAGKRLWWTAGLMPHEPRTVAMGPAGPRGSCRQEQQTVPRIPAGTVLQYGFYFLTRQLQTPSHRPQTCLGRGKRPLHLVRLSSDGVAPASDP